MVSKHAVELQELSFAYGQTPILDSVSQTISTGEFIALIGPNGGGKTTLLKLLMGFLTPTKGRALLFGSPPEEQRQRIGYVPQVLPFDRSFPISVEELVLTGTLAQTPWHGRYSHQSRLAAKEALERVGLSNLLNRSFGTLSGGQAQRALIARALACKPDLLLLDEPMANVDAQAEGVISALLDELKGQITIIMVTHDFGIALKRVDRVLCVQRQVYSMNAEQVCDHFAVGLYHPPLPGGKRP